jgi:hypothetical protein
MAAILTPALANLFDPSGRGSLRLVAGLAALLIGARALAGSAVQPQARFPPAVVPVETANQTAGVRRAVGHDGARPTQPPAHNGSAGERALADRRAAPTTRDRPGGDLETALARGTRAESAHVATFPLRSDPRDALVEMAMAAQLTR